MKIYLAGKIEKNCWRHSIIPQLRNVWPNTQSRCGCVESYSNNEVVIKDCYDLFDYAGPFFIGDDHGCGHGENSHGVNSDCSCEINLKKPLHDYCFDLIYDSDIFFAYINSNDCHGTLAEIGYAYSLNTPIYICWANKKLQREMHFIDGMAKKSVINKSAHTGYNEIFEDEIVMRILTEEEQ